MLEFGLACSPATPLSRFTQPLAATSSVSIVSPPATRAGHKESTRAGRGLEATDLGIVLHPGICKVKEEGQRELRRRHAGQFHGHLLGQTKPKNAIDTLKVRRVASCDAAKLGEGVEVAELHDVCRLISLQV